MINRALALFAATTVLMALGSSAATADTTHVFLKDITVATGGGVEPEGVDAQGNLIVWLNEQHAVAKYDTNGNPVNFSALGTNMIDGSGGHNCPTTPADCDRVPTTNGFTGVTRTNEIVNLVAVDNSGGPANGYIYVLNNYVDVKGEQQSETDVFDASGQYKGKIDDSQVFPDRGGLAEYPQASISVASNGVLYIIVPGAHLTLTHVDRYVPVDGNPAHDQFSGQIRAACANAVCVDSLAGFASGAGGLNYFYASGYDHTHEKKPGDPGSYYMRFPQSEFHRPGLLNFAVSEDFSPDAGPFGPSGGFWGPIGSYLRVIAVDPTDQHVYIGEGWGGIQEWDEHNHRIGPMFASEGCPGNAPNPYPNCKIGDYTVMDTIAFASVGPNKGDIYVRAPATNEIAVFSPPVTIPDINHPTVTTGHTTAELEANIGRAGGEPVTDCHIDYCFKEPSTTETYASTMPCDAPTPYAGDTDVKAEFSGLFPETTYHYRVVASSNAGTNATDDSTFHTFAVLGVHADPASNLTRTSADLNGSLNPDGINTTYHFEYGVSTQYNNRTPEKPAGSAPGEQSVAPENITGLQPGRTYHFRLAAKNSLGKTKGPDQTFRTWRRTPRNSTPGSTPSATTPPTTSSTGRRPATARRHRKWTSARSSNRSSPPLRSPGCRRGSSISGSSRRANGARPPVPIPSSPSCPLPAPTLTSARKRTPTTCRTAGPTSWSRRGPRAT